jgi:hypothetical protein
MSGDHNQYQKPTGKDSLQVEAMKQEPVGWMYEDELPIGYPYDAMFPYSKVDFVRMFPVYAPPEREWIGLTDEEIDACDPSDECWNLEAVARAIEAKLKEKNAYGWQSVSNPTEYLDDLRGGKDT